MRNSAAATLLGRRPPLGSNWLHPRPGDNKISLHAPAAHLDRCPARLLSPKHPPRGVDQGTIELITCTFMSLCTPQTESTLPVWPLFNEAGSTPNGSARTRTQRGSRRFPDEKRDSLEALRRGKLVPGVWRWLQRVLSAAFASKGELGGSDPTWEGEAVEAEAVEGAGAQDGAVVRRQRKCARGKESASERRSCWLG